jgi:hypothetical protein
VDSPCLANVLNDARNGRVDKSTPLPSAIDLVGLSAIEGNVTTGIDAADLAIELATVQLFPADDRFEIASTELTMAVSTQNEDLIRAVQTTDQNSQVVSTDGNVDDTTTEMEDGGDVSSDGLTNVLRVSRHELDMVSTTKVSVGQLSC